MNATSVVGCGGESCFVRRFGKVWNGVTTLVSNFYAGVLEDVNFSDLL